MEYSEHYDNLVNRHLVCKEYEGRGLRMLHDNFDPDWQPGEEPHGVLIFTDVPEKPPPPPGRDIFLELDDLKTRVVKLEKGGAA